MNTINLTKDINKFAQHLLDRFDDVPVYLQSNDISVTPNFLSYDTYIENFPTINLEGFGTGSFIDLFRPSKTTSTVSKPVEVVSTPEITTPSDSDLKPPATTDSPVIPETTIPEPVVNNSGQNDRIVYNDNSSQLTDEEILNSDNILDNLFDRSKLISISRLNGLKRRLDSVKRTYRALRDSNVSLAAISGILANAEYESGYNHEILGDNGSSKGLFQYHYLNGKGHRDNYERAYQNNYSHGNQIKYLLSEFKKISKLSNYTTATDPYQFGYDMTVLFERPVNKSTKAALRGKRAREIYEYLKSKLNKK